MEQNNLNQNSRKKIIIIGGGFAGIAALRKLVKVDADVTVIDKHSSQVFQPLLFQVATCNISAEDLQSPIRQFLKNHQHIQFIKDEVVKIDRESKKVHLELGWELSYDYLLITTGSVTNYYGMEDVATNSKCLKSARDALKLRTHILNQLDIAANSDPAERSRHLTFVVAGGGATGVELCGSLVELLRDDWSNYYPKLKDEVPKVYLLEGANCILANLPQKEQQKAICWLKKMGVEVRLEAQISGYDGRFVKVGDDTIETETLVWCAGVRANPLLDTLGLEQGHARRIVVKPTLQALEDDSIFVAGDSAHFEQVPGERPLPMTAAVATQAGELVGRNLRALVRNTPLENFKYKDKGFIAIVSRGKAVGLVQGHAMRGWLCWAIWAALHIFLPYSKHIRWSLFWKLLWNAVTSGSPYRNTYE